MRARVWNARVKVLDVGVPLQKRLVADPGGASDWARFQNNPNQRMMRRGQQGPDVAALQGRLTELGYMTEAQRQMIAASQDRGVPSNMAFDKDV